MKVSELVKLLQKADPEAEVFSEFEGSINAIAPDDVRVAPVHLVRLIAKGEVVSPGNAPHHYNFDCWTTRTDDEKRIVRSCEGVLLGAGQSDSEWPVRLGSR
jgi:hypothetical protein